MRRLALGLITVCLTAVVSACSSYGSALSGTGASSISNVVISSPNGGTLKLANQPGAFLLLTATAYSGSTITATQAFDQTFQWQAFYAGPPATYNTSVGGAPVACPAAPTGPLAAAALFTSPAITTGSSTTGAPLSGGAVPYVPGNSVATNQIYVSPIVNPQINAAGPAVAAYCLQIIAKQTLNGVTGSTIVFVSN